MSELVGRAVHLVDANDVPVCPEAERLDAMTDAEFWENVAVSLGVGCPPDDCDFDEVDLAQHFGSPCPECGETGPCAFDAEGRPMIHLVEKGVDDE